MPIISPTAISPHNAILNKRKPQPRAVQHEARRASWLVAVVAYFRKLLTVKKH